MKSKEEIEEIGGYVVFYMEHTIIKEGTSDWSGNGNFESGEMKSELKKKIIPVNLKDKFTDTFGERLKENSLCLTGEEIDGFLNQNKDE
jgi:hypothetical protein